MPNSALSARKLQVFDALSQTPGATNDTLAKNLGLSLSYVKKIVQKLKSDESIKVTKNNYMHPRYGWCNGRNCETVAIKDTDARNFKLSEESILEIKKLKQAGLSQRELAKRFGVSQPTISKVINQKIWKEC